MESYIREHAALYDDFYREKDYPAEVAFIDSILKRRERPVKNILEIACGTGNHSFLLEKKGYALYCTDASPGMISMADNKKAQSASSIQFSVADMRSIPLYDARFDAALCLFDSLGYAVTNEGILNTLKGINKNLADDGILIFECWHASAMLRHYDPVRVKKIQTAGSSITRISETSINYAEQTATVHYTFHQYITNNTFHTFSEDLRCRFFLMQEINLFLSDSGFRLLNAYNGYRPEELIDDDTWHIVCVAQKISG